MCRCSKKMGNKSTNGKLSKPPRGLRKYIRYLDSNKLSWAPFAVANIPSGLRVKVLNQNRGIPLSFLLKIPQRWETKTDFFLRSDVEGLVLDGQVKLGSHTLGKLGYFYIPARRITGPLSTANGCTLFVWAEGNIVVTNVSHDMARDTNGIEFKDSNKLTWSDDGMAKSKLLNDHPNNTRV